MAKIDKEKEINNKNKKESTTKRVTSKKNTKTEAKTTKKTSSKKTTVKKVTPKKEKDVKEVIKPVVEEPVVEKEIKVMDEPVEKEEKDNKKYLLILLLLLFLVVFGISVTFGKDVLNNLSEQIIDVIGLNKPTAPQITGGNIKWAKERLVRIEKDSETRVGLSYYEYCVREEKSTDKCKWQKTDTKNVKVVETGKWYVTFRGVDKEERRGYNSNTEIVYIDNNNPVIQNIKVKEVTTNSIKVEVEAKDEHSGIKSYLYSLDGKTFKEGKINYTYTNLKSESKYTIYVKVVDKTGNEIVLSIDIKTKDNISDNTDNSTDNKEENENQENNKPEQDNNENIDKPEEEKPEPPKEEEPEEVKIPEINLDKVPAEFTYGESYGLPSYVDFKGDTGTYECIVEGKEYSDTSTLKIGKHLIVCTATSSSNVKVMVEKEVTIKVGVGEEEVWDGWIRLNLYYPENSTNWQWRLGLEDEIRSGYENTGWEEYTGPILVKLDDVDDVYIRYDIDGKTYVIAPNGKVAVDIEPNKYSLRENEKAEVKIYFEEGLKTKEYRIGNGKWTSYTESFEVEANTIIEARGVREEKVYDSDGNFLYTAIITGTDSIFIGEYVSELDDNEEINGTVSGGYTGSISFTSSTLSSGVMVTVPSSGSQASTYLAGPIINSNPSDELVESVEVTVTPQEVAEKIYVKVGNGSYKEYTGSIEVKENTIIRAYYIRRIDGKQSSESYYYVENIKKGNKPHVKITALPDNYLSETVENVEISISGSDYDTLEYSLDGVIYKRYTNPLTITESTTVYAKGINSVGETVVSKIITTKISATPKEELDVSIHVKPTEEEVDGLINKAVVSIDYDEKAESKYYRIGYYGEWKKYIKEFEVESNTTVYAYCTSENGIGNAAKGISYLTTGISSPIIKADTKTKAPQVKVEITYDKNADVKRYRIGDGPLLDYNGAFYVYENAKIYAYNKNVLGNEAESNLNITNIVPSPDYIVIDQGSYYIIKLNYPDKSKTKEYKWKLEGIWKEYSEQGILLIKPEYKEEIEMGTDGIVVLDEQGNEIIFKDHYYFIDVPLNELFENLFMRWENEKPETPEIMLNPISATKEVKVIINYASNIIKKYYKVVSPSGKDTGWQEYTGPVEVTENNTVIYAKGENRIELMSEASSTKITNIDEIAPVISVEGNFEMPKQKVTVSVNATDDLMMYMVMYAKGEQNKEYFKDNGISIRNNGTFTVNENGKYTIYAVDQVGNETVKVIEVNNIDKNAPNLIIDVLTDRFGPEAEVSIEYGDSKVKQYRIGENSTEYKTYTENIIIKANDVLNLVNEDGTLTIYAKGEDEAGNITEVSEKIYVLDLDAPKVPVIHSTAGYPVLTEYGVVLGQDNHITYDARDDIDNYYSIDNGETWIRYTGPFEISNGTILAKSVKKVSGLTVTSSKKVQMPSDALKPDAYDSNEDTSVAVGYGKSKKIYISPELSGKYIELYMYIGYFQAHKVVFYDESGKALQTYQLSSENINTTSKFLRNKYLIPNNASYVVFVDTLSHRTNSSVYEVSVYSTPTITSTKHYPLLTEYGINEGYNDVIIEYFQTSVKRLYRINDGEWQNYQDKAISLKTGDIIETKGIDKYGNETLISKYTSSLPSDALSLEAYDNKEDTSVAIGYGKSKKIYISPELSGKYIELYIYIGYFQAHKVVFYDEFGKVLKTYQLSSENINTTSKFLRNKYLIPDNTSYLVFVDTLSHRTNSSVYEVSVYSTPTITSTKHYPLLTEYGINEGYNDVIIEYFQTSVKRLYRINDGEWQNYQDKAISLKTGDIIETKGIDKYGNETLISKYTSSLPSDALALEAYDENEDTYTEYSGTKKMHISKEMQNRNMLLSAKWITAYSFKQGHVRFYDSSGNSLSSIAITSSGTTYNKKEVKIPNNAVSFTIVSSEGYKVRAIEISPSYMPIITQKNIYTNFLLNSFEDYSIEVNINYLSYLPQKLYSLDNGATWLEYTEPFKVKVGDVIKAKAIDESGTESSIASYTVAAISDNLDSKVFDGDKTTVTIAKNTNKVFTLGNDTIGKDIRFFFNGTIASNATINIYDKSSKLLESISIINSITVFKVPLDAYKIVINAGSSNLTISEINIRKISIDNVNINPIIETDSVEWTADKTIIITYPEGYINQYSLDMGETWHEYLSPITVDKPLVVLARSVENGKTVASSSYTITKIDDTIPTITLDIPSEILYKTEYVIPTDFKVDNDKSGGSAVCKVGDNVITNTKDLSMGEHEITCTVTTGVGKEASVSKIVNIIDEEISINLDIPDSIVVGSSYNLPTSVAGSTYICKVGETVITNTKDLLVGEHEIICSVTSIGGNTKEVTKKVNIIDEEISINLDIPDSIVVGSDYNLPTSVTGSNYVCKIGEDVVTNTKDLGVGEHEIICSVTSIGGNTKEVTKKIQVIEDNITEENPEEPGEGEVVEDEATNE